MWKPSFVGYHGDVAGLSITLPLYWDLTLSIARAEMYDQCKTIQIPNSVSTQVKNLQVRVVWIFIFSYHSDKVVSFDSEWREIYVGLVRKDLFTGECPNNDVSKAAKISVKYKTKDRPENAIITAAKWWGDLIVFSSLRGYPGSKIFRPLQYFIYTTN